MAPMNPTERSKALYDACVDKGWEAAIALCSCEAKSEGIDCSKARDKRGRTCLHEAIIKRAPCGVIRAILDAHKERSVSVLRLKDGDDRTALHTAAFWFRSSHNDAALLKILLESDPHCATLPDKYGCTPLHHMVNVKPPRENNEESAIRVACARALLNASTTESILLPDLYCKRTVLHKACSYSAVPPEIVQMILGHFPQAALAKDKHGNTPLHCVAHKGYDNDHTYVNCAKIRLLLESLTMQGQYGAVAVNDNGETPLHFEARYKFDDAIKLLIESQPESVFIKDKNEMTPLDLVHPDCTGISFDRLSEHGEAACSSPHFISRCKEVCVRYNLILKPMLSVQRRSILLTVEDSLSMITEYESDIKEKHLICRLIHDYLWLGSECPLHLLVFLQTKCPHHAQMKDSRGDLPLHIALENGVQHATFQTFCSYKCRPTSINGSSMIKALIDAYPQAAKVPNRDGDLPFHILLQNRTDDSEWHYSVQPLLIANPAALLYEMIESLPVLLPRILSRVGKGKGLLAVHAFVREMPHLFFG